MTSETICRQLGPVSDRWLRDLGQGKKKKPKGVTFVLRPTCGRG